MKNPSALIIEDDKKLAYIFAKALEAAQFETEVIQAGNTALERLAVLVPDVVVLDLHLPYASGQDILGQIRADERLVNTRVILTTADLLRAKLVEDDVDEVIIKPVSFQRLRDIAIRFYPEQS